MSHLSSTAELPGIGVFGTGVAVRCLVPILKNCGFKVEAIWGRTPELAAECARDLDVGFHTHKVDQVLLNKEVDLVLIYCLPLLKAPIAAKALGIGKHVICGTPVGPGQIEAMKMVNAAEYYPSLMSIMCNGLRFLPCFTKMKQLISEEGYVGTVTSCEARVHCSSLIKNNFDWLCEEAMGGGVLNIYGSLFIDLITFLTGQKALRVQGMVRTFTKQTEAICGIRRITSDDFCTFQMELSQESCAVVTVNSNASCQYQQELLICGTKGRLVVRGSDLFGQKSDCAKEETIHRDAPCILDHQKTGVMESIAANIPIPHMKGLFRLIDSVKEAFKMVEERHGWSHQPVLAATSFTEQQYVQTVVDAVRQSSRTREWVKVKVISEEGRSEPLQKGAKGTNH